MCNKTSEINTIISHLRRLPCECDLGDGYICRPHRWIKEMEAYRDMDELIGMAVINQALSDLSEFGSVVLDDELVATVVLNTAAEHGIADHGELGISVRKYRMRRYDVNIMDTRYIVERV